MAIWLIILIVIFVVFYIIGGIITFRGEIKSEGEFFIILFWVVITKILIIGSIIYFGFINNDWLFYKL